MAQIEAVAYLSGRITAAISCNTLAEMFDLMQKILTSGENITINADSETLTITISSTGGSGSSVWGAITGTLSAQTDLQNALNAKVDKVTGKQLSTEDYTTTEKYKLAGIEAGAEVNVNADWNATSGDAEILNKPTILTNTPATVTIAVADWSGGTTCTKTVSGVTATSVNLWSIAEAQRAKVIQFDVRPSAQGTDSVTFTADATPDAEIVLNLTIQK